MISLGYEFIDFSKIQFNKDNFNEARNIIILRTRNISNKNIIHSHTNVDRCCKSRSSDIFDVPELVYDGKDEIERISCDITKESFLREYVKKRRPVMLKGCHKRWPARKWTFKGILWSDKGKYAIFIYG